MNTSQTQLAHVQEAQLATRHEPTIAEMMSAVIEKGITADSVSVMEKMMELKERMDDKAAERAFTAAFVALQSDLPVIVASSTIQNRGKYERFEDLMHAVGPLLIKHGFTVSFSMDCNDNRILETCHLKHVAGHSQSNSFAVRAGKGDTDTQADCKAATTAKRYAFMNALNLVVRQDALQDESGDAAVIGAPISFEQVQTLRELVKDTGSDESKFLAFAQVARYEDIGTSVYPMLFSQLNRKPRK